MTHSRTIIALHVALFSILCSCASAPREAYVPEIDSPRLTVEGDWDDVRAVLAGILPQFHIVQTELPSDDPSLRRFKLVTLEDHPGVLTLRRVDADHVEICASVGRFPDKAEDIKLVRALGRRFVQLRGHVAAPILKP